MIALIEQKKASIVEACQKYGVQRLEVFGSAARDDFDAQKSDLDFIAKFIPPLHPGVADRFIGLADTLESIFARRVDLLTEAMIRNPIFREEVNRDRTPIYDYRGPETTA